MYLLIPFLLLRLWWKGRRLPGYRKGSAERFCLDSRPNETCDVWIHAVSLGEVIAATPLIKALLAKKRKLLITTTTPTGKKQVLKSFDSQVTHRYFPYDLPFVLRRFFKRVQPKAGVIMETELWPNMIHIAAEFHIPLLLVNARLSDSSCRNYKKVGFLLTPALNQLTAILAQSAHDAERFKEIGAANSKVEVLGNVKFDAHTNEINTAVFSELKQIWGVHRLCVIAASTHDNEEAQILAQWRTLQAQIPDAVLLIAPRHPERFSSVFELSKQSGFKTGLRSQPETINENSEVIILDSLGELLGFYQISDYAFVGGSFVPIGGHNVLEPIAMNVPVLTGKYLHNFKTICEDLENAEAIEIVDDAQALMNRIIALEADKEKRDALIKNAHHILQINKGAVARYVERIEESLSSAGSI